MSARRNTGNTLVGVLVLLLIVGGAGGWNYHRNLEAEKAETAKNVYAGYTDQNIQDLVNAYEAELSVYSQRQTAAQRQRVHVSDQGSVGENARQFEAAKRHGQQVRELTAEVAQREARLSELKKELQRRESLEEGLMLHLKRLTTLPTG